MVEKINISGLTCPERGWENVKKDRRESYSISQRWISVNSHGEIPRSEHPLDVRNILGPIPPASSHRASHLHFRAVRAKATHENIPTPTRVSYLVLLAQVMASQDPNTARKFACQTAMIYDGAVLIHRRGKQFSPETGPESPTADGHVDTSTKPIATS